MPVYDGNITIVQKGTAPTQTIVEKPYLPAALAITTEDDQELLAEDAQVLLVEGTI